LKILQANESVVLDPTLQANESVVLDPTLLLTSCAWTVTNRVSWTKTVVAKSLFSDMFELAIPGG